MSLDRDSKPIDLEAINSLLINIYRDLSDEWPIVPRKSLIAQRDFLDAVKAFHQKNPVLSLETCISRVRDDYVRTRRLQDVIWMSPNVRVLGIFKVFPTLTSDLIDRAIAKLPERKSAPDTTQAQRIKLKNLSIFNVFPHLIRSLFDSTTAPTEKKYAQGQPSSSPTETTPLLSNRMKQN